jgi:GT2 family glycosyltransferase
MSLPSISIIAATHNGQSFLAGLIASCAALDYPSELIEVIVVDDESEPPVSVARTELRVRVLRQRQAGPASALNSGVRAASGELIAITGDDCRPRPDWLRALVRAWAGNVDALIGGCARDGLGTSVFSRASQSLIECYQDYSERTSSTNYRFFPATNIACSRARFLDLGGFEEVSPVAAGEDRDLCRRWRAIGPLISAPDAVVDRAHPLSAVEFLATHFRIGWGTRILRVRRSPRGGERFRLEPLSFYLNLVAFPFRSSPMPRAAITAALLLAAQGCTGAGSL